MTTRRHLTTELFPVVLNSRDMNALLRFIEEQDDLINDSLEFDVLTAFPIDEDISIDDMKAKVLQMNSRQLRLFLDQLGKFALRQLSTISSGESVSPFLEISLTETRQNLRSAIGFINQIKSRIRR